MDEKLLAKAILSGPDAIIAAGRDGVITFWNAGAERIFGFTEADAVGQSLDLIIPQRFRARHWAGWQRVMGSGQSRYSAGDVLAVPAVRQDGATVSVEFTIHLLRDASAELIGIATLLRDVTARYQEIRELRQQLGEQLSKPTTPTDEQESPCAPTHQAQLNVSASTAMPSSAAS
jgi:PAS domain S-box-containing protein